MPTLKLEDKELLTLAHLVGGEIHETDDFPVNADQARGLVRLALVVDNAQREHGLGRPVLDGAPAWLYAYIGRRIGVLRTPINRPALAPPAKPKAKRKK